MPYTWGTVGILYNTTDVDEADVTGWELLWNEKYAGKILMFDNSRDAFGIAQLRLGYDLNTTDKDQLQKCAELLAQQKASLTTKIVPIALVDRGVIRAGMDVLKNGEKVGWVTSGTMVPYWNFDENGNKLETSGKRSIGFACIAGAPQVGDEVQVDVRGKKLKAVVVAKHMIQNEPPYGKAVIHK